MKAFTMKPGATHLNYFEVSGPKFEPEDEGQLVTMVDLIDLLKPHEQVLYNGKPSTWTGHHFEETILPCALCPMERPLAPSFMMQMARK